MGHYDSGGGNVRGNVYSRVGDLCARRGRGGIGKGRIKNDGISFNAYRYIDADLDHRHDSSAKKSKIYAPYLRAVFALRDIKTSAVNIGYGDVFGP